MLTILTHTRTINNNLLGMANFVFKNDVRAAGHLSSFLAVQGATLFVGNSDNRAMTPMRRPGKTSLHV